VKTSTGYETASVQTGKASGVSSTALTVTSSDGYKQTYVLTSSTKGTAKDAATVTVVATKTGSTWTAQAVLTPGSRPRGGFGPGGGRGFGGPGGHGPGGHGPGQPKPFASPSPTAGA
jgi:hypothetical protein